jgi:hypothetical protein
MFASDEWSTFVEINAKSTAGCYETDEGGRVGMLFYGVILFRIHTRLVFLFTNFTC